MTDNGTTIHWHGFRQLGSNEADGVNASGAPRTNIYAVVAD